MDTKPEGRVTCHDREIAAIRKLVLTGMRMLVRLEGKMDRHLNESAGEHEAIRQDIRALAASQRETDRALRGLIRSLERGSNGNRRRDVR